MADAAVINTAPPSRIRRLLREPRAVIAGGFILFLLFCAVFAPLIAPLDPLEQDLLLEKAPPVWMEGSDTNYLLGADSLGRDLLSRLIHAARVSMIVAFVAGSLACLLGTTLGLFAGFFGGWVDTIISRLVDIWMSFPPVLLLILLVAVLGSGLHSVIVAIVVIDWTRFCRILLREILPNVFPVILVLLSLEMGIAVIVEAILSFVGLSVSSDTPTWGGMIAGGRQVIHHAWWILVFPLAALFLTVLAFNQLGDGLRNALDPALRR